VNGDPSSITDKLFNGTLWFSLLFLIVVCVSASWLVAFPRESRFRRWRPRIVMIAGILALITFGVVTYHNIYGDIGKRINEQTIVWRNTVPVEQKTWSEVKGLFK